MNPIRCLIVDDKPLAIDIICTYAASVPFLQVAGTTTNPIEVLTWVAGTPAEPPVELLFLDIQMPGLTGIQLMKLLDSHTRVILTSAYADYALDGFEHNAIDYLMKPVSFERFYKAALRAKTLLRPEMVDTATPPAVLNADARTHLFVKVEQRLVRVDIQSIMYVEGMQNYAVIHTTEDRVITLQTLKQLEGQLPSDRFMRVHKSYIVHLPRINAIERNRISIGPQLIPIGDTYLAQFRERIGL